MRFEIVIAVAVPAIETRQLWLVRPCEPVVNGFIGLRLKRISK